MKKLLYPHLLSIIAPLAYVSLAPLAGLYLFFQFRHLGILPFALLILPATPAVVALIEDKQRRGVALPRSWETSPEEWDKALEDLIKSKAESDTA